MLNALVEVMFVFAAVCIGVVMAFAVGMCIWCGLRAMKE